MSHIKCSRCSELATHFINKPDDVLPPLCDEHYTQEHYVLMMAIPGDHVGHFKNVLDHDPDTMRFVKEIEFHDGYTHVRIYYTASDEIEDVCIAMANKARALLRVYKPITEWRKNRDHDQEV